MLTSVTMPNSVTSIGGVAFGNCLKLYSVIIGSGVVSMGNNVFEGHKPKKIIWLPNTPPQGYSDNSGYLNYVANESYEDLSNVFIYPHLSSMFEVGGIIYVPVNPAERTCDIIDCSYSERAKNINLTRTVNNKGISMNVKNIRPYSFYNNDSIKELKIDIDGEIPEYIFYSCDNIPKIEINSNITNIGEYAFYNCHSLTSATIKNKGNIGYSAFRECSSLASVIIENKGNIGESAFYGCSSLASINLRNTGSVESSAFAECSNAETLQIAPTVTSIRNEAFRGCDKIINVTIEDRETILWLGYNDSDGALFRDCPLDKVYIGGKIKYDTSRAHPINIGD